MARLAPGQLLGTAMVEATTAEVGLEWPERVQAGIAELMLE